MYVSACARARARVRPDVCPCVRPFLRARMPSWLCARVSVLPCACVRACATCTIATSFGFPPATLLIHCGLGPSTAPTCERAMCGLHRDTCRATCHRDDRCEATRSCRSRSHAWAVRCTLDELRRTPRVHLQQKFAREEPRLEIVLNARTNRPA